MNDGYDALCLDKIHQQIEDKFANVKKDADAAEVACACANYLQHEEQITAVGSAAAQVENAARIIPTTTNLL